MTTIYQILEWLRSWDDAVLTREIERIEASADNGQFISDSIEKQYALLLGERARRKLETA